MNYAERKAEREATLLWSSLLQLIARSKTIDDAYVAAARAGLSEVCARISIEAEREACK